MGRIVVTEFISLDGIVRSPGGPEEFNVTKVVVTEYVSPDGVVQAPAGERSST
jgi:hypothetical protein